MRPCDRTDSSLVGELLLLAAAAPALYFPQRFPTWAVYASLLLLIGGWIWRRWRLGIWYVPTPADWPLFLLFGVMLPISIWAAPAPLREQYSIPRAYILLWNFCLFWVVATYGSRSRRYIELALAGFALLALAIALVAPLGMNWLYKFAGFQSLIAAIPSPLVGVFAGAEEGFHPNQVAGTLLYALPLLLALSVAEFLHRGQTLAMRSTRWLVWLAMPVVGLVLLLTQSRAALLGLVVGLVVMALLNWRWGWWLIVGTLLALVTGFVLFPGFLGAMANEPRFVNMAGGAEYVNLRREVWFYALMTLHDFALTGVGLGAFREIIFLLYPVTIPADYNLGHAHNMFLQAALDLGIPGLVMLLAILLNALGACISLLMYRGYPSSRFEQLEQTSTERQQDAGMPHGIQVRFPAVGLIGAYTAYAVFGQVDAVALGAKTDFFFWYLLSFTFALANLVHTHYRSSASAQ